RLADRYRVGRAELPDRAPPVPQHAPAVLAARPAARPGLLRPAGTALYRNGVDRFLRRRAEPPACPRRAASRRRPGPELTGPDWSPIQAGQLPSLRLSCP